MGDYASLAVVILIFLALLIFREEVKLLVRWIVGVKRLSKTPDGYSVEVSPKEPEGAAPAETRILPDDDGEGDKDGQTAVTWIREMHEGRYEEALKNLDALLDESGDATKSVALNAQRGYVLFERDADQGVAHFEDLIARDPAAVPPYQWYALSYYFQHLYPEALAVVERGLSATNDAPELMTEKADCLSAMGETEQAMDVLSKAIGSGSREPVHFKRLAAWKVEQGEVEAAEAVLLEGIRLRPGNSAVKEGYANFLWEQKRYEEAALQFRQLGSVDPDRASHVAMLGNCYLGLDLYDAALTMYERAMDVSESDEAWILGNVGNLYNRRSLFGKAIEHLEKAATMDPQSQYAHDRLSEAIRDRDSEQEKVKEAESRARSLFQEKRRQVEEESENREATED